MKQIEINKRFYNVPESWADITVWQVIEFEKIPRETMDVGANKRLLSVALKADEKEIETFPFEIFVQLILEISETLSKPLEGKFQPQIQIDGVTYNAREITEFSTREFIDFDSMASQNDKADLPLLLALIYMDDADGENYIVGVKRRAKIFSEKMSAETALAAIVFFSKCCLRFVTNTVDCSAAGKLTPKMMEQLKVIREFVDGVGY